MTTANKSSKPMSPQQKWREKTGHKNINLLLCPADLALVAAHAERAGGIKSASALRELMRAGAAALAAAEEKNGVDK